MIIRRLNSFIPIAALLLSLPVSGSQISIDSLLATMTVEEKIGQMTQVDLGVIAKGKICELAEPRSLDTAKLRAAFEKYKVGSVLNVGCGSGTIGLEEWRTIISQLHSANKQYSRTGIPVLYGIDAIHGANYVLGATLFPQPIGQAATWNPELVQQLNAITAYETRAAGIPWNFSPVLDIGRQPLWSRFFETYGEDVLLASSMGQAAVRGMQGDDLNDPHRVASCMKHFLGYSFPLSGRDRTPAWISPRELREYFLPTFEAAIAAGARSVMINSGEINGTPVHADRSIVTTLLRDELDFTGVAVTDWEDIYKLVDVHHVAANRRAAVKLAIDAGIDMSMTPNDYEFTTLLVDLVKSGEISEARIDTSVRRILRLKLELGLFDNLTYSNEEYTQFASAANAETSYRVACESITLLKNEKGILPLDILKDKLLVCGPAAASLNLLNGGWTHTWQGTDTRFNTKGKKTILQALNEQAAEGSVSYSQGSTTDSLLDVDRCVKLSSSVDKIVVCLGETPCTEIPGNIDDLSLPKAQQELVEKLVATGKPVILICCFNRPRIIHTLLPKVAAVMYAYLPGDEGGRAIADCITGKQAPGGRLPFTYPAASNALLKYDHKFSEELDVDFSRNGFRPEFEFGSGLSYTTFSYSSAALSADTLSGDGQVDFNVRVKNTGNRSGQEVLQVYYRDEVASITPSVKKLAAFTKIKLDAGEEREVVFKLKRKDFSFINKDLNRVTESGEFVIMIADKKTPLYVR
ncbi:MAG: hypothetical protein RIQ47_55 [Bacteroidota bacterium]|jgi:beta-glucosidase